ncbi:MAG: IS3 family transposase [Treponema sp.]|nr:IS3 family transposase [Treponema sp.]
MREELRSTYGKRVSRKKVARLMRENGRNARRRGKFIPTTTSNHGLPVCENLLNREFHAEKGGEKGVSWDLSPPSRICVPSWVGYT